MEYRISLMEDGTPLVALVGPINEDAELSLQNLTHELGEAKTVTFNFALVKSINSLGVRAWVNFMRGVSEGRSLNFVECVPDVIMQINMIPSFQNKAAIRSFFTNYVCESCDATRRVLIQTSALPPKSIPAPQNCQNCGQTMETEELEEEYFAFLLR